MKTGAQVKAKVERRMATIDALTLEQRAFVYEFGWRLTKTFLEVGVSNPRHMRRVVLDVLTELRPPEVAGMQPGPQMLRALQRERA